MTMANCRVSWTEKFLHSSTKFSVCTLRGYSLKVLKMKKYVTLCQGHSSVAVNSQSSFASKHDKRHVIVTGGNSGIGKATATELARRGYDVTLACRNDEAGKSAAEEISQITNNRDVRSMICDIGSLDSVRSFAANYQARGSPLNVLVNNAGIMACPQAYTVDGFESQFGVNHLGHFLLSGLLMDKLISSATESFKSRVVVLASAAHFFGDINFDDLNYKSRAYSKWGAYAQSKLANCLFALELAKRCRQLRLPIISNSMHPGVVDTNLTRYTFPQGLKERIEGQGMFQNEFRSIIIKLLGIKTASEGASTAIFLADSPDVRSSGLYYENSKVAISSFKARDERLASRLWDVSVTMTNAEDVLGPLKFCREASLVTK